MTDSTTDLPRPDQLSPQGKFNSYFKLIDPIIRAGLRFLIRFLFRWQVEGQEHVPAKGPIILAPNHPTFLDPVIVYISSPRDVTWIADQDYFISIMGKIMRYYGAIPIDASGMASREALRTVLNVLNDGKVFGIYPEGMRSCGDRMLPFKPGAAQFAVQTGAPIVPVSISGATRVWPRHWRFPKPYGRIKVTFLPPLYPPTGLVGEKKKEAIINLNDRLRAAIASDTDYPPLEESYPKRPLLREMLTSFGYPPPTP